MFQTIPPRAANSFMDQGALSMKALIAMVAADAELSPVRRRNLASSIRRFCAALGLDPAQVPANHWYFRERLKRFHPLSAGIQKKRWQTIKADVSFAFGRAGIGEGQPRGLPALTPAWQDFKKLMVAPRFTWGLSRLARFCSAQGLTPKDVDDRVMASFSKAMESESFKTRPAQLSRDVCMLWNQAGERRPDLGIQRLTVPSNRKVCTSPWLELPAEFRNEADTWLLEMSMEADIFSDSERTKPLRPASITTYRYALRQCFAALVAAGVSVVAITSLDVLIQRDNAEKIVQHFFDRNGGKTSSMVHNIAHVLVLIATTRTPPDEVLIQWLKKVRKRLAPKHTGLRPRPREALRQFVDTANIEKILSFPLKIFERLKRKQSLGRRDARLMQTAVTLELLLMRPLRRKNVVELRLDHNIIRSGRETFVRLPSEQVKNNADLDYRLPAESVALLDFYIKKLLPLLGPNPDGWLFPGESPGRHKTGEQFGRQLSKTIKEMTGLYFFPHLARHFGAYLYLKENPGAFEVVRRVLGHRSLTTTTRSYVSFDSDSAVQLYDDVILRIRDTIKQEIDNENAHP